jgi:hypothetical protein
MAVNEHKTVMVFEDWYDKRQIDPRTGAFANYAIAPCADRTYREYDKYKSEMDSRTKNFWKLDTLAAGEVLTKRDDLSNVSSGDVAGMVRRTSRNIVQNTPNVEVISEFDDDSTEGILTRHILLTKIIGTDAYSNDMQQNLFASTMGAFVRGFDCVVPVLLQDAQGGWYIKYDSIHYRDVFPEAGAKDVKQAHRVYVRRYLSKSDVHALIKDETAGWDTAALRTMMQNSPPNRRHESSSHEVKKQGQLPEGYEIATLYTDTGDPFLTFDVRSKILLRIEKNLHPKKQHPVHFLVLEKDDQQPLGKSMVELLLGRQEFQDLLLNGAMKMWYWGINPTLIGRGVNTTPMLAPGKFINLSNPNAVIEPMEVSTQTLQSFGLISQQNSGAMIQTAGAADPQMAAGAGTGMSATPQGVDAQAQMVDITTNNYQKAVENFFSHYCSYAMCIYFQELKGMKKMTPNAEARLKLLKAGLDTELIDPKTRAIEIEFSKLAIEYFVRCVPGSLTELEDEKQVRVLQEMLVPVSQAMPAIAALQDPDMTKAATQTVRHIMGQLIKLSGSADAKAIAEIWQGKDVATINERDAKIAELESGSEEVAEVLTQSNEVTSQTMATIQEQVAGLADVLQEIITKMAPQQNAPTGQPAPQNGLSGPEQPVARKPLVENPVLTP